MAVAITSNHLQPLFSPQAIPFPVAHPFPPFDHGFLQDATRISTRLSTEGCDKLPLRVFNDLILHPSATSPRTTLKTRGITLPDHKMIRFRYHIPSLYNRGRLTITNGHTTITMLFTWIRNAIWFANILLLCMLTLFNLQSTSNSLEPSILTYLPSSGIQNSVCPCSIY